MGVQPALRVARFDALSLIPTALKLDRCIMAVADGVDAAGLGGEVIPGFAAGIDNGVVGFVDAVGELVLAEELPDVFLGVEFGAVGWQPQQADVFGDAKAAAGAMPAGAVEHDDGVGAFADLGADLLKVQVHGPDVGAGRDPGRAHASGGADSAEQIGPFVALVARGARSAAALGPDPGQGSLLADAGFVLPPDLDRPVALGFGYGAGDQIGEVFLCACSAAGSFSG